MEMQTVLAVGTAILCLACLIDLPFAKRANQTLAGFFLMDGKLQIGGFLAAILSANLALGNFLVFIATWGFIFGWAGIFWFLINLCLNVVAYFVFVPAFKAYIEDHHNSGTIHEFLSQTFGSKEAAQKIRLVASATTVLGLLFATVFELHLAAEIFARLLHIDVIILFALLTALICIYSGVGGFHTLIFTDVLQSITMIIGTVAVVIILFSLSESASAVSIGAAYPFSLAAIDIGWPNILSICVVGSGWFLVAMDQWQRTCATRSAKRTKSGMILYLVSIAGFAIAYGLVGVLCKTAILPSLTPELLKQSTQGANPLADLFLTATTVPADAYLYALAALALLAAAMSTANTFLIVCGHSFVSDVLLAFFKESSIHDLPPNQNRVFLGVARGSIIGMGIFVISAWLILNQAGLLDDPLSFFFIAYSIQYALLAPMIFARFDSTGHPSGLAVFHSIWLGVLVALVGGMTFWLLIQAKVPSILGLPPVDWLTLSPVITMLFGLGTLLLCRIRGVRK